MKLKPVLARLVLIAAFLAAPAAPGRPAQAAIPQLAPQAADTLDTAFIPGESTAGLLPAAAAGPQSPLAVEAYVSEDIRAMVVSTRTSNLLWSSTVVDFCPGGEFAETCTVRRKPTSNGFTYSIHARNDLPTLESNLATDDAYVYWIDSAGQVVRKSIWAATAAAPTVLTTKQFITTTNWIAVDATHVYWIENHPNPLGRVFRAPKTGGTRQLMQQYSSTTFSNLRADGHGGVFYQSSFLATLIRTSPLSSSTFTSTVGPALVYSFAVGPSVVYWTDAVTTVTRVRTAPIAGFHLDTTTTRHVIAGQPTVPAMAIDNANLYWHQVNAGTGPIQRMPLASGGPTAITPNQLAADELASSGRYLFWHNGEVISRVETDSAALQLDLRVADIEITQGIQNLDNDVPLIQDKWTMVRVYPGLSNSTVPTRMAVVRLHGSRGGSPLPGSPLLSMVEARTTDYQRDVLTDSANFRLPQSWLNGSVTFTATISVHDLFDTNLSNNNRVITRAFQPKSDLCIKFLPVWTTSGLEYRTRSLASGALNPGFAAILDRLRTLWPTPEIRWYTQVTSLRKPALLSPNRPFNMQDGVDKDWLIFALWEHNLYDEAPAWCGGNNARTHYMAMINPNIDTGNGGYASLVDVLSYARMLTGGDSFDGPSAGAIAAQELGHNHNGLSGDRWKHVGCNLPDTDDPHDDYPYPTNQIAPTGVREYWGFDRRTNAIIRGQDAADYMSYCGPRWTSDYTWRGLMNITGNLPAASPASGQGVDADNIAVAGVIELDESGAELTVLSRAPAEVMQLSAEAAARNATAPVPGADVLYLPGGDGGAHIHVTGSFAVQFLSAADGVLATHPVAPTEGTHGGGFSFFLTALFPPGTAHVRLTRNGTEMARRSISANAPVVSVTQPAGGTVAGTSLAIAWTGSDADGDALSYLVQYSPNGADWQVIASGLGVTSLLLADTSGLAGSTQARIRVIANDGVNTSIGESAPFTMLGHAPEPVIDSPLPGQALLAYEEAALRGQAVDSEDGILAGSALQWSLAGPSPRAGSGSELSFFNLAPGPYTATLTATDSDGMGAAVQSSFFVSPKRIYDGAAPVLDGYCDDAGYSTDVEPLMLRYSDGAAALVRFVHASPYTYVCFKGMPIGSQSSQYAGLRLDLDNSGGSNLLASDRMFFVRRDGQAQTGTGNGGSGITFDAVPNGLIASVSENNGMWNAEMRIDDTRLNGWNKIIKMQVGHYGRNHSLDFTLWPAASSWFSPSAWGLTTLGQRTQSITFPLLDDRSLSGLPVEVHATASSGLPVSFSSNTPAVCSVGVGVVVLHTVGLCSLAASQPGNGSYFAAGIINRSFNVDDAPLFTDIYLPVIKR